MPRGPRKPKSPAGQGLKEGKALELVLSGAYDPEIDRRLWQKACTPKRLDRGHLGSWNIPDVAHAIELHLGETAGGGATWWADYCTDQLSGATGLLGREGANTGQYWAFSTSATAAAIPRLSGSTRELARRRLHALLALGAVCAVPREVDPSQKLSNDITVLGVGQRIQLHHLGPATLLLAAALGAHVDQKWQQRLPDPRRMLSTDPGDLDGLQIHAWPWRVSCLVGAAAEALAVRGYLHDLVRGVPSPGALELARTIRLWSGLEVIRFEQALALLVPRSLTIESAPCYGALSVYGQPVQWLDIDPDVRGNLAHGKAWIAQWDSRVAAEGFGIITFAAESPGTGRRGAITADLAGAGRLLYHLEWPADCGELIVHHA